MKKIALLLSLSVLPDAAQAVTTVVEAGKVVDGGEVNIVETQQVYGTADNFNVYGNQQIMNGGVTHNSDIFPAGHQNIEKGGTSYNTSVQGFAIQNIRGNAYSSDVKDNGTINVNNGGYAEGATVAGGELFVLKGGTANGTVINAGTEYVSGTDKNTVIKGGTQQVKRGGYTEKTQVDGGVQKIEVGGTAENTTVNFGQQDVYGDALKTQLNNGTMNVYDTGYAEGTLVNGGNMIINSGAFVKETTLAGGSEDVYGYDIESTIKGGVQRVQNGGVSEESNITGTGIQEIYVGGRAFNNTLSSGGTQQVNSGGIAYRTNISSGGIMNVSGEAFEAAVSEGGNMTVLSGGTSENTTLSGGIMTVSRDAAAKSTIINSGTQNVFGKDYNASVNGGSQIIKGGGEASGTVVTGNGIQIVEKDGNASGVTVKSGGRQQVFGQAEGTVAAKGGTIELENGAKAVSTRVNGGDIYVRKGAEAQNTSIKYGTENVEGISRNAAVNAFGFQNVLSGGETFGTRINFWGTQNVQAGGTASAGLINFGGVQNVYGIAADTVVSGGRQNVRNGGMAVATGVNGGILTVYDGGTAKDAKLKNGWLILNSGGALQGKTTASNGIITIAGDNSIPHLELDKTLVNVNYRAKHTTLQIGRLDGSGTFNMTSNLSGGTADTINVNGGDGNFGLIIHDYSMGVAPSQYKIIDESLNAHDNFYLVGGGVDVGAFRYKLEQENNDWYLVRTGQLSDTSYVAKNTHSSLSSLFYSHLNPVFNRLRVGHKAAEHDSGLWVKGLGRKIKFHFKDKTHSSLEIYGSAIGFDHEVWHNESSHVKVGVYTGYTDTRQKYDRAGRGDADTHSLGMYSSLNTVDNWFVDVVGTYFWHDQKIRSYTPSGADVDGKYKTHSWQASVFTGRRINLRDNWFVEPSAGFSYMHINGADYRTNFNTLVEMSNAGYFSGNAGLVGGKKFAVGKNSSLDAYGRFNLIYDWDGKNEIKVASYSMTEDIAFLRYEFGAGVNFVWDKDSSVYMEASTQLGDQVDIPWEINLGLQYDF